MKRKLLSIIILRKRLVSRVICFFFFHLSKQAAGVFASLFVRGKVSLMMSRISAKCFWVTLVYRVNELVECRCFFLT